MVRNIINKAILYSKSLRMMAYIESKTPFRGDIPLLMRIKYLSKGFSSRSIIIYDLTRNSPKYYVSDWSILRKDSINKNIRSIVDIKSCFYKILHPDYDSYLPQVYGIIKDDRAFGMNGQCIGTQVVNWLEELMLSQGAIVLKPDAGSGGRNVYVVERQGDSYRVNGEEINLSALSSLLSFNEDYLAMQYVQQAEYAEHVYPDALNTIRIVTLWDYDVGEPYVAGAMHRFGVSDSRPTDNCSRGALSVGIDLERGLLLKGTQYPKIAKKKWYASHPETGVAIEGRSIPGWNDMCRTVIELAKLIWHLPILGWDLAATQDGFVILEANSRPALRMLQAHRPFLGNTRNRQFFKRYGLL